MRQQHPEVHCVYLYSCNSISARRPQSLQIQTVGREAVLQRKFVLPQSLHILFAPRLNPVPVRAGYSRLLLPAAFASRGTDW